MARLAFALGLIALVSAAGCIQPEDEPASDPVPTPPANEPVSEAMCLRPDLEATGSPGGQASVANHPGSFSYSGQTTAQTGREVYLWQNAAAAALISWGGQAATGDLKVAIQDVCGKEVYTAVVGMMSQGGSSETSGSGEPGEWFIILDFTTFTGQMGLSVNSA